MQREEYLMFKIDQLRKEKSIQKGGLALYLLFIIILASLMDIDSVLLLIIVIVGWILNLLFTNKIKENILLHEKELDTFVEKSES